MTQLHIGKTVAPHPRMSINGCVDKRNSQFWEFEKVFSGDIRTDAEILRRTFPGLSSPDAEAILVGADKVRLSVAVEVTDVRAGIFLQSALRLKHISSTTEQELETLDRIDHLLFEWFTLRTPTYDTKVELEKMIEVSGPEVLSNDRHEWLLRLASHFTRDLEQDLDWLIMRRQILLGQVNDFQVDESDRSRVEVEVVRIRALQLDMLIEDLKTPFVQESRRQLLSDLGYSIGPKLAAELRLSIPNDAQCYVPGWVDQLDVVLINWYRGDKTTLETRKSIQELREIPIHDDTPLKVRVLDHLVEALSGPEVVASLGKLHMRALANRGWSLSKH